MRAGAGGEFDWNPVLIMGTVLTAGEPPGAERAIAAAGHGAAVGLHFAMEFGQTGGLANVPEWAAVYEAIPEDERHLALHDQHLIAVNERDKPFVTGELLQAQGLALDHGAWRDRLAGLEAGGATEVAYQPAGNDIPRELEAFAALLT
mgnify:CR=1 FL=1